MTSVQKIVASLFIVGTLTVGGVACGKSDSSKADSPASVEAWCKRLEAAEKQESDNPDLDESSKAYEALAKDAPAAIRDDMQLIASVVSEMDSVDFMDEKAVKAFEEKYDEDELDAATGRIETFAKDKCGISLDAE